MISASPCTSPEPHKAFWQGHHTLTCQTSFLLANLLKGFVKRLLGLPSLEHAAWSVPLDQRSQMVIFHANLWRRTDAGQEPIQPVLAITSQEACKCEFGVGSSERPFNRSSKSCLNSLCSRVYLKETCITGAVQICKPVTSLQCPLWSTRACAHPVPARTQHNLRLQNELLFALKPGTDLKSSHFT